MLNTKLIWLGLSLGIIVSLVACGGGSSNEGIENPVFESGVFENENLFKIFVKYLERVRNNFLVSHSQIETEVPCKKIIGLDLGVIILTYGITK